MRRKRSYHKCGSPKCDCPVHKMRMYYHISGNAHACQDPECEYARGYEAVLVERLNERMYERRHETHDLPTEWSGPR